MKRQSGPNKYEGKSEGKFDALSESQVYDKANNVALRLLGFKQRSERGLFDALIEREFPEEIAEKIVERFRELHLLNDSEFAVAIVRSEMLRKIRSATLTKAKLEQMGFEESTITQALESIDPEEYENLARHYIQERIYKCDGQDRYKIFHKALSAASRKGIDFDIVYQEFDAIHNATVYS